MNHPIIVTTLAVLIMTTNITDNSLQQQLRLIEKNRERICICIPARYKSSRLPGKLLYKLGDKTCIQRTIEQALLLHLPIYVLTDHKLIKTHVDNELHFTDNDDVTTIITSSQHRNGTERISYTLQQQLIPNKYDIIVNIQADEPFINPNNIIYAIYRNILIINDTHTDIIRNRDLFYTTLHQEITPHTPEQIQYLTSTSSVKVITSNTNRVLTYSRAIIPWNKSNTIDPMTTYKLFTGVYVFNRIHLEQYSQLCDTPLQLHEDVEQLKILEHNYDIYSFPTIEYNEISLNDREDLTILCNKYNLPYTPHEICDNNFK